MFYSNIMYLAIAIYLFYKLLKKEFNLFHVLIFVLPFHSWMYNVGLNLNIYQIVTLIMAFMIFIQTIYRKKNLLNFGNKLIVLFMLYAIVDTMVMSIFFINDYMQLGGFFRSEGRFIAQIILMLITFSIVPLAYNYIKNIDDAIKYLKVYLYALILLVILGWIQFFTYKITGVDIFPLGIDEYGNFRTGIFDKIFRMSSLGGEPKGFSMSLTIGFFIIHIFNNYGIRFFKYDIVLKYLFIYTAFATLSTSGMVLFAILLFVYQFYIAIKSKKYFKLNRKNIFYSFIIVAIISFLLFRYWDFISMIIEQRIFERDLVHEDYDKPIQIFLTNFPEYLFLGSGLGNIHNLAAPYISFESLHYMKNTIFLAKSGYLRTISELGLIGFSLFTYMIYSVYRKLGKVGKCINLFDGNIFKAMQLLLFIALVAYFARIYLIGELILFLAISNVLTFSKQIRRKEIE